MSLVERALAKMRATAGTVPSNPAPLRETVPFAHLQTASADITTPLASAATDRSPTLRQRRPTHRLTTVDRVALRSVGLLAPEDQERRTAEEYRHIKRPVIAAARTDKRGSVVMVTSAFSGEGKSFTSVNLAMSLSLEKDWTVLLVDADVIKPQISRLFGLEGERGLIDALGDETLDPDSLIVDTDVPGLSVLPSGRRDDQATELLASARMNQVITQLAQQEQGRILVFDSPPMLQTSEAKVLATFMGQVIVVVFANRTPQTAVLEAVSLIGENDKVKLVLNKADRGRGGYYYGGYGYGYGYHDAVARAERAQ